MVPTSNMGSWLHIRERLSTIFSLIWIKQQGGRMDAKDLQEKMKGLRNVLQGLQSIEKNILDTAQLETSNILDVIIDDIQSLQNACSLIFSKMANNVSST